MVRNPFWARDEVILALYRRLDFGHRSGAFRQDSREIVELSTTLNRLGVHTAGERNPDFRNGNGVYMKLCNFLAFDPEYEGKGLKAGSKLDRKVWDELADRPGELANLSAAIERNLPAPNEADRPVPLDDEFEAPEGRVLIGQHFSRERSSALRSRKIAEAMQKQGTLPCEVCGLVFEERYGKIGEGFIECHHRVALADLEPGRATRLSDLALVCSNCHSMLHRAGGLAPDGLRSRLRRWPGKG